MSSPRLSTFDLAFPRYCFVCGRRLYAARDFVCESCRERMPYLDNLHEPYDNEMARNLWGRIAHIQKAVSLLQYSSKAKSVYPIYQIKYNHQPQLAVAIGRYMAEEMQKEDFFDDIDAIVPIPLAPERERARGYNQSERLALGMQMVTALPVLNHALERSSFKDSQTQKQRWDRNENVDKLFRLCDEGQVKGRHLLLVDDVMTTGATLTACARQLNQVEGVRISVATIGFVSNRR
jgi:ComF family protein